MKKYYYVFLSILFFLFCPNVLALQNSGALSDLTISDNGRFYDNRSSGNTSIGYNITNVNDEYYQAFPTGSTTYTYNGFGGSLVQCGMSFAQGNYYSVTYYYLSDSSSYYYHPFYTQLTNKLGIGDNIYINTPTFTYENVNSDVQLKLVEGLGYLSSYTVIFKAPKTGTCLLSAFSSNPTSNSSAMGFVGYKYESLGSSQLSASDIQNALNSSFNSINNSIGAATGSIIGSINSGNESINNNINAATGSVLGSITSSSESINNNIDSMKDKQDETNTKLDEANETSKGILGKIGDLITSIPEWFSNLASSIGEFFANLTSSIGEFFASLGENIANGFTGLFDGIKSLFFGEEVKECETIKNYFTPLDITVDSSNNVLSSYLRPLDDNGWFYITSFSEYNRYSHSIMSDLKTDTYYTFIIESKDITGLPVTVGSTLYNDIPIMLAYPGSQFKTVGTPAISNNKKTIVKLQTVSDFSNSKVGFNFYRYGDNYFKNVKGYFRIMILEGNLSTEEANNIEYFKTTKEECHVVSSSGGLFGILGNMVSSIGKWFSDLTSSIGEFFSNLLTGILDGLKSLFVPNDDQLYEIINDSKELTENFGFVGESMSFFLTIFTSLLGLVNHNGCLELPSFSIGETSLFDEHVFWESQNVCLSDNAILSNNIDSIRSITSIVLVCMFINFAVSKFFTILSKNDFANDVSGVDYSMEGSNVTRTEYWTRGTNTFRKRERHYHGGVD